VELYRCPHIRDHSKTKISFEIKNKNKPNNFLYWHCPYKRDSRFVRLRQSLSTPKVKVMRMLDERQFHRGHQESFLKVVSERPFERGSQGDSKELFKTHGTLERLGSKGGMTSISV
jgi:hypothetical protein